MNTWNLHPPGLGQIFLERSWLIPEFIAFYPILRRRPLWQCQITHRRAYRTKSPTRTCRLVLISSCFSAYLPFPYWPLMPLCLLPSPFLTFCLLPLLSSPQILSQTEAPLMALLYFCRFSNQWEKIFWQNNLSNFVVAARRLAQRAFWSEFGVFPKRTKKISGWSRFLFRI